jgi:hypothetical protein
MSSALDLRQRLLLLLGAGRNLNPCVEQTGAVPFNNSFRFRTNGVRYL